MVKVTTASGIDFYMDNYLHKQVEKVRAGLVKKDKDSVWIVDGSEGSGKSVFAMQLGAALDPTLSLDRICFTPEEFTRAIVIAEKGECVIFDEAFTGLSSRSSLSEVNKLLVSLMMEMRQKNLIVIIVMPTFFLLDKYVALWRAKGLFHIYTSNGKRGRWRFYNKNKKKILYLTGKQTYNYSKPRSSFMGRFLDKYMVDEEEYRKKKKGALFGKSRYTKAEKFIHQRNILLTIIYEEFGKTLNEISELCEKYNMKLGKSTIKDSMDSAKETISYEKRHKV